jgi:nucleotide-binding universal stress UspA family protein
VEYYSAESDREAPMFNNVLVGVGDHESWRDAIALAKQLVSGNGRLTVANIYVFEAEPRLSAGYSREVEAAERERAAKLLRIARAEAGMPAAARWRGAPSVGRGLRELADRLEADLLVVGTSRQGLLGRGLRGDTVRAALNGAPCAVAMAPAGYAERPCEIRRVGMSHERSAKQLARNSGSADLLVLGSRAYGPLGRLVDRSRYRKLSRAARCPVLVLPRGVHRLAAAEALLQDGDASLVAAEFS